ncbi:protein of unknown function DUF77 [Pseudodesulfovibrio mercurii]|uniref:Thiamine-binding protein domain-containing protein n=1 Tax=Pseudodesulfovibrio mercurii TaxID=641491 RepID=F0JKJ3_9BACT|nr:MTH1187 family thiamine-binding protein [Pseudodesulfovibrio mercurii]EGB16442.1 protein of unknown function DUF77 [Pseudodesulfovibrio mercurii]
MGVIIDLSIFPLDKGGSGLSTYVSRALNVIKESGLKYRLCPMGTSIEGEWDDVMKVVDGCYRAIAKDSDRLYMTIKVDARKGRDDGMSQKLHSVESKLA